MIEKRNKRYWSVEEAIAYLDAKVLGIFDFLLKQGFTIIKKERGDDESQAN